jgi:hypothetical protein
LAIPVFDALLDEVQPDVDFRQLISSFDRQVLPEIRYDGVTRLDPPADFRIAQVNDLAALILEELRPSISMSFQRPAFFPYVSYITRSPIWLYLIGRGNNDSRGNND